MFLIALGVLGWVLCGVLAYGLELGMFQDPQALPLVCLTNQRRDRWFGVLNGLLGPIGLVGALFAHVLSQVRPVLRWRFATPEEAWAGARSKYPHSNWQLKDFEPGGMCGPMAK
jgi:hypothetical protein